MLPKFNDINLYSTIKKAFGKLSHLAETLIGSEIVRLGADIREKINKGEKIYNFTIGDFDSAIFPIPKKLEHEIIEAYKERFTTYPPADGLLSLRNAVSEFIMEREGIHFTSSEILIAAGGRPLIYALFRAIVDRGDKVIYSVPSWNNNHYVHFVEGKHQVIEASAENNFMPLASEIKPFISDAALLSLCSPLNPTGTVFKRKELEEICDMVLEENNRRGTEEKKLYIMYDQMYWTLTFGETQHFNPVSLRPEMKNYTIFIDGISKAFAGTGVRVGWALGPSHVLAKMRAINSHVGAWSPMAEQHAVAKYLLQKESIDKYLENFKGELEERLVRIYNGFQELRSEGFKVDACAPQAAIYLTVQIDIVGQVTEKGIILEKQKDVTAYILDIARLAIVPFYAFGTAESSSWYRLSVGTCKREEIDEMLFKLKEALSKLSN